MVHRTREDFLRLIEPSIEQREALTLADQGRTLGLIEQRKTLGLVEQGKTLHGLIEQRKTLRADRAQGRL